MSLGSKCGFSIAMESGCNVSDLMSLILRRDALLFWLTFSFFSSVDIVILGCFLAWYASRRCLLIMSLCSAVIDTLRALALSRRRSLGSTTWFSTGAWHSKIIIVIQFIGPEHTQTHMWGWVRRTCVGLSDTFCVTRLLGVFCSKYSHLTIDIIKGEGYTCHAWNQNNNPLQTIMNKYWPYLTH